MSRATKREKKYILTCAPNEVKSACALAQSESSLSCPHEESLHLAIQNAPSEDADQTAQMRRLTCLSLVAYVHRYAVFALTLKAPVTTIVVCFVFCRLL